jgi:hypothetical protein
MVVYRTSQVVGSRVGPSRQRRKALDTALDSQEQKGPQGRTHKVSPDSLKPTGHIGDS